MSDVTSGRSLCWEWGPDAGDAEDGITTSDASGRGTRASDAGLIFADVYMELTIPSWETDPFRNEIKPTIAASNDSACPVYAMQQFRDLDTNLPQHAPLFCIGQHKQEEFTRAYLVQKLQSLAFTAGLGHCTSNGHSFRRGATTGATEIGLSEIEIQTLGR